jgi:phosphatidylglycerophosphate synthase
MDKQTARTIADLLTWSRIWSVIPISVLAWYDMKWWVLGLYIAAALTDLFDGMFARRGAPPKNDTDLDGLADLLFQVMTLIWIWLLIPEVVVKYWLPYLPILLALEAYVIQARLRYVDLKVPHLEFGRKGMVLFCTLLPALIIWGDVTWFVHLVLIVGVLGKSQGAWAVHGLTKNLNPAS